MNLITVFILYFKGMVAHIFWNMECKHVKQWLFYDCKSSLQAFVTNFKLEIHFFDWNLFVNLILK